MSRRPSEQHHLSDLQTFLVANLREQTKLKAELAQLIRSGQKAFLTPRITKLRDDLVTLELIMEMRCRREEILTPNSAGAKSSDVPAQNGGDVFTRLQNNAH